MRFNICIAESVENVSIFAMTFCRLDQRCAMLDFQAGVIEAILPGYDLPEVPFRVKVQRISVCLNPKLSSRTSDAGD